MARLLTREEASKYIGIDPKTFDKVFRADPDFKRFHNIYGSILSETT